VKDDDHRNFCDERDIDHGSGSQAWGMLV